MGRGRSRSGLLRHLRTVCVAAVAATVALAAPLAAASITADGAGCTLADAIRAANTDAGVGGSSCSAGSGADTIVLDYDAVLDAADAVASGSSDLLGGIAALPDVASDVTIAAGLGTTIARDPALACGEPPRAPSG